MKAQLRRRVRATAVLEKLRKLRASRGILRKTVTIDTTKARKEFSECVNVITYRHQRVVLKRRGKAVAAMVPVEDLELIREIEDAIDVAAAKKAKEEPGEVPWEDVKRDLGL